MKHYKNISQILTLSSAHSKDGRNLLPSDLSIIEKGSIVFDDEAILWIGQTSKLPEKYHKLPSQDLSGMTLTPELVDSHTHLLFGGDRAIEYSMRLNGADYQEIALSGGGILNTMNGTNTLSKEELFDLACERIETIHSYGVGTIEIKSGYGLNFEKEYECSHIIDALKKRFSPKVQIINTFMAAHAVPKEFSSSSEYMNQAVLPLLQKLSDEGVIDCVDIFHEKGYFSDADLRALFSKASELKINLKSHADEFHDNKGALLAASSAALSADHLLCTEDDGIKALANSNTVATFLPGTGFFLGKKQADARRFLDAGCKVAIASDFNPGSCHCDNLLLLSSFAAPHFKMNISELWSSITLNASHALGLKNQGVLKTGMRPRFSLFNTDGLDHITYNWGKNLSVKLP